MSHRSSFEVIGIGIHAVDILVRLPEKWRAGEKFLVQELELQGGGPAATALCVCAKLGFSSAFIGRLGDDLMNTIVRDQFTAFGVSTDLLIRDPGARSGMALIQVDSQSAERTIFYNVNGYHFLRPEDLPVTAIRKVKVLLVDGYEPSAVRHALQLIQKTACRSILDLDEGEPDQLFELIALSTDIILPLGCALRLSGCKDAHSAIESLRKRTKGQLIITDGTNGSWALTNQGVIHQPAFRVKHVDSTGCGDAFHGGFAVGLLAGWSLELRLEFASWIASIVAQHLGGRGGLPNRKALHEADLRLLSKALQEKIRKL